MSEGAHWITELKEGDTLFLANRWSARDNREVKVTRIGRAWIHLSGGMRMARITGKLDNCYSFEPFPNEKTWKDWVNRTERARRAAGLINTLLGSLTDEQLTQIEQALVSGKKVLRQSYL